MRRQRAVTLMREHLKKTDGGPDLRDIPLFTRRHRELPSRAAI
jgi:hypothetical protein